MVQHESKDINLNDLKEYENNPRNNEAAVKAVAESIKQFGFRVPLVIDKDGVIICGHTRLKAARLLQLETAPCVVAENLTPEQVRAYRLADNKTGELAEWDFEKLEEELAQLTAFDVNMTSFGFDESLFDTATAEEDNFDVEEELAAIEEPVAQEGDIWQLGRNRLICGDSTQQKTIKRLVNGGNVDLLITDPPYNVNYEGAAGKIQNDNMSDKAFKEFLKAAFAAADSALKPGAPFYIWHAESEGVSFRLACKDTAWKIRQCLIWVKNNFVIGRQDYQWTHEPCLYGWKDGAAHYFIDDRTQRTVIEDKINISKLKLNELRELCKELMEQDVQTTVIHEDKPLSNDLHPTMKPVKLLGRLIKNSSRKGDIVLDVFGGSGSTLIACEQLERVCYMVELDTKFCDVIIKRWETLTGQKAEKLTS